MRESALLKRNFVFAESCVHSKYPVVGTMRRRVKFELGLTVSIGVSYNKIFAKLGSDMNKPDGMTVITRENFREKIWHLPADDMLGVGRSAIKVLNRFGIRTIGDLANCSEELLSCKFGINGPRMKRFANGEDCSAVMQKEFKFPIKSVGNGITFLSDLHSNAEVYPMILALADEVASRLREAHKKARGVALMVRCNDLAWKEWQCSLEFMTCNAVEIASRCFELFRANYPWVKPIRALTVRAIRLSEDYESEQLSLTHDCSRIEKVETLDGVVDSIRRRFGQRSIGSATTLHLDKMPEADDEVEIVMPTGMLTMA